MHGLPEPESRSAAWFICPQSGVRRNGRVVQGQPTVAEAREEHEGDSDEHDNAESVSLLTEHHQPEDLRDTVGKSPLCQPRQKTVTRSLGRSQKNLQDFTPTALDPSNLSPRIVDGTEDSEGTETSQMFSFSTGLGCPVSEPTSASTSTTGMLHISTTELAAKAEETRGQLRHLDQQVSTLRREVADLGQVMKRMATLMEALTPSVPQPAIICPTHYSPAHQTYLHCPSPPQPCHSPSKAAPIWTDPPMPLPCSSLTISQQHSAMCYADSLTHRPQSLQLVCPAIIPKSTPPLTPDLSSRQPPLPLSVIPEPPLPSSSIRLRVHSSLPLDGGGEDPHKSPGCSSQTGPVRLYLSQS